MRKLILQMQTSLDLFVCDEKGSTEGFVWNWEPDWKWDQKLQEEFIRLKQSMDCVLLSRKMAAEGFIDYWHSIAAQEANPAARFATEIDRARKIIFSKSKRESSWPRADFATEDLATTIQKLKGQNGKEMIAYGGAGLAKELIRTGFVDELHLYVNPVVFGKGESIFQKIAEKLPVQLTEAKGFDCGVVVLKYRMRKSPNVPRPLHTGNAG